MTEAVPLVSYPGNCPGCGQGNGRPHYERCLIQPPDYGRRLNRHEVYALTAYVIGIFPLDVIRRSTIRALLPRGDSRGQPTAAERKAGKVSHNLVSDAFGSELKALARRGWIDRREDCVVVLQRWRVLRSGTRRLEGKPELAVALRQSLAGVAAGLPEEITLAGQAQRAAELRALRDLMEETPLAGPHGGRGMVRLASRPDMLS